MFDWFKKKRPDFGSGWYDINEYPIPGNERSFLVSDGKTVEPQYEACYDRNGKAYAFFYKGGRKYITHWMRYPLPPTTPKQLKSLLNM